MTRKIEDIGVKVGGARKERKANSVATAKRSEGLPAWLPKGVEVCLAVEGKPYAKAIKYQSFGQGNWMILKRGVTRPRVAADGFSTREEAISRLPYLFWSYVLSVARSTTEGQWCIYRRKRSANMLIACRDGFASYEEATAYAEGHAPELISLRFPSPELPKLKTIARVGPDYRGGRDITGEELCETFGLCGVEYGEWLPDKERQESLNHCFDAFADLARLLHLERGSIGFGGLLCVAFGSRGVSNFQAHFEPQRFVFNLTRMKGAGQVAHEWFHALDYYLGARTKGIVLDRQDPGLYEKTASVVPMSDLVLEDGPFRELILGLQNRYVYGEEAKERICRWRDRARELIQPSFDRYVSALRKSRKGFPIQEHEIRRVENLMTHLGRWAACHDLFFKEYREFEELYAKAKGMSYYKLEVSSECNRLFQSIMQYLSSVDALRSKVMRVYVGASNYQAESARIDLGRTKPYWSSRKEMAARAFGAFIEDCLVAEGNLSQFLVHSHRNEACKNWKLFPEGVERQTVNRLFKELFHSIRI